MFYYTIPHRQYLIQNIHIILTLICKISVFDDRSGEREFMILLFKFEDVYRQFGCRRLDLYAGRVNKCGLRNRQPAGSCRSKDLIIYWTGRVRVTDFFAGWVSCKRTT